MLGFTPNLDGIRPLRVLCLGAHSDDIEIGCGTTIFQLIEKVQPLDIRWIVFSGQCSRSEEAKSSAEFWLESVHLKQIELHGFRDGFFPDQRSTIKETFEKVKESYSPDIIFTHYQEDLHQDHRTINQLTWNTFRNHVIMEYEIPKYDGDMGSPNLYVPVSEEIAEKKAVALVKYFNSQGDKHWFDKNLFMGLMRIRGMESCSPSGYAEGFYSRKISLDL
ncbi:MAG: PIG-L deacetylase family protein [Pontiella sp.]